MRDAVEKSIGDAVAGNLLGGGDASGRLRVDEGTDALVDDSHSNDVTGWSKATGSGRKRSLLTHP